MQLTPGSTKTAVCSGYEHSLKGRSVQWDLLRSQPQESWRGARAMMSGVLSGVCGRRLTQVRRFPLYDLRDARHARCYRGDDYSISHALPHLCDGL